MYSINTKCKAHLQTNINQCTVVLKLGALLCIIDKKQIIVFPQNELLIIRA